MGWGKGFEDMQKGQFAHLSYNVVSSNTGSPLWPRQRVNAPCTRGSRVAGPQHFGKGFEDVNKGQFAHLIYDVASSKTGSPLPFRRHGNQTRNPSLIHEPPVPSKRQAWDPDENTVRQTSAKTLRAHRYSAAEGSGPRTACMPIGPVIVSVNSLPSPPKPAVVGLTRSEPLIHRPGPPPTRIPSRPSSAGHARDQARGTGRPSSARAIRMRKYERKYEPKPEQTNKTHCDAAPKEMAGLLLLDEMIRQYRPAHLMDSNTRDDSYSLQAHHVVKVRVEHCTAPRPSIHLRGNSQKYVDAFNALHRELSKLRGFGVLSVEANPEGSPRIGSFEVSFTLEDTQTRKLLGPFVVFSKLKQGCWPSHNKLVAQLRTGLQMLTQHAN